MSIMSYYEIRSDFADASYSACRNVASILNKNPKYIMPEGSDQAFAYEACEGSFSEPVEDLMLELVTLIFMAGRGSPETVNYHKDKISKILSINDLDDLLEKVTEDDRVDILYDLKLLGFINNS